MRDFVIGKIETWCWSKPVKAPGRKHTTLCRQQHWKMSS